MRRLCELTLIRARPQAHYPTAATTGLWRSKRPNTGIYESLTYLRSSREQHLLPLRADRNGGSGSVAATSNEAARNSVQLTFGNRRVQFGSNSKGSVKVSSKYFESPAAKRIRSKWQSDHHRQHHHNHHLNLIRKWKGGTK